MIDNVLAQAFVAADHCRDLGLGANAVDAGYEDGSFQTSEVSLEECPETAYAGDDVLVERGLDVWRHRPQRAGRFIDIHAGGGVGESVGGHLPASGREQLVLAQRVYADANHGLTQISA